MPHRRTCLPHLVTFPLVFLLVLALAACDGGVPVGGGATLTGVSTNSDLDEVSGMAASRVQPGRLWLHDDSGNPPRLFAISPHATDLGTWTVEDAGKVDWEDIASFDEHGKPYLLIADTGDNGGVRKVLTLLAVPEPQAGARGDTVRPAWRVQFRWPDGARDCEAMTVDERAGVALLITKKRQPPQLFEVSLHPTGAGVQTAKLVGLLPDIPQPDARDIADNPTLAKLSTQVTAADLSPDGLTLAVLTYRHVLLYRRDSRDMPWHEAFVRHPPRELPMPLLPQPEAIAWSQDGQRLYLSGEMAPALIYAVTP